MLIIIVGTVRKDNKFTGWEIVCIVMLAMRIINRFLYEYKIPYNISPNEHRRVSDWSEPAYAHLRFIQYISISSFVEWLYEAYISSAAMPYYRAKGNGNILQW